MHCNIRELASDPSNYWAYCPSSSIAITFAVFFAITTATHAAQVYYYRAWTAIIVTIAGAIETCALILRVEAVRTLSSTGVFKGQYVLILVAPLWINAYVFTLLGRLVRYGLPGATVLGLPAKRIARVFVSLDILTFLIQMAGAVLTTIPSPEMIPIGFHVYTAGVVLQQVFLLLFASLTVVFDCQCRVQAESRTLGKVKTVLRAIYVSLLLITLRTVFRIVEFSGSNTGKISRNVSSHEVYLYAFDLAPMLLVLILFNIAHPAHHIRRLDVASEGAVLEQETPNAVRALAKIRIDRLVRKTRSGDTLQSDQIELVNR